MSTGDVTELASRLRERITIQSLNLTSDGLGGNTESWSDVASLYAEVEPLISSAREQVVAEQREALAGYRMVIRKRDDISSEMRVIWQGKTLYIHGVISTRVTTEILAYEGGEA